MLSCVILASGLSERIGTNKLLLKYKGKCIVQNILEEAIKSDCFNEVIVVVSDVNVKEIVDTYNVNVLWNDRASLGQSEAIKLAVKNVNENSDGIMFCVGDQPLVNGEVIKRLVSEFNNNIVIPMHNERRGNPVIFPKSTFNELLELSGDIGGRVVINNNQGIVKLVEFSQEYFFRDIDTKEDYDNLLKDGWMTSEK